MARRAAEGAGHSRVAIVGTGTRIGDRLREVLARRGVPGTRVDLFGTTRGETLLSEYGGEARLIQEPDRAELVRHGIIFVCEATEDTTALAAMAGTGPLVLDLTGLAAPEGTPLIHMGINPEAVGDHRGILAVPHPLAAVLAEMLHPIQCAVGLAQATALVLRPAADFGEEGIAELREQTVRLLRFERIPRQTFGRQLAFNLIPQSLLGDEEKDLERRIVREVSKLLGWTRTRFAVRLVAAPVFHGHAVALRVEPERAAGPGDLMDALGRSHDIGPPRRKQAGTPLDAPEARRTEVCEIVEDEMGGFWIWAIAGDVGAAGAEQAVLAASALTEL